MFGKKKKRKAKDGPAAGSEAADPAAADRVADQEVRPPRTATHPERIGRYTIVEPLGEGGMGRVYGGTDPVIGRRVAIKVITMRPDLTEEEARQYRERFLREAQAAGALVHPNIVAVYDVGQDQATGSPYIVMEHVAGQDLRKVIQSRAPLPAAEAVRIVLQIAVALDFAHRRGIVHRDIKPANVLISGRGQVKITDFGVARLPGSDLTRSDQFVGSPGFMSPEQLRGAAVDGRADLFALGVILYELLTGRAPFEGDSVSEVLYRITTQPAEPPSEACPDVSPDFDLILEKALCKDPDSRFQSGQKMIEALRALPLDAPGTEARADGADNTAGAGRPAPAEAAPAAASARRPAGLSAWWSLDSQWRLGTLMTLLLLTLVAVNWGILYLVRGPLGRAAMAAEARAAASGSIGGSAPLALAVPGASPAARTGSATPAPPSICAMSFADPEPLAQVLALRAAVAPVAAPATAPPPAKLRLDLKHRLTTGRVMVLVDGKTVLSRPLQETSGEVGAETHLLSVAAGAHAVEVRLLGKQGVLEVKSKITGTIQHERTAVLQAEHRASREKGSSPELTLAWRDAR